MEEGNRQWGPSVTTHTQADISATKTFYNGKLASGWNTIFTVPQKKSYVLTNIWGRSSHGSAVTLRFEHQYSGGVAVEYWGIDFDPGATPPIRNVHEKGAKVFEAGSVLRINSSVADVVGLTLDGAEVAQT